MSNPDGPAQEANLQDEAVAVPSQTVNPRDPFAVFDAGIAYMIVSQLSAVDTESLRRVSKVWKAASEAHCGRLALLRHFPEAAVHVRDEAPGSAEEENLRFRRYCESFWLTMFISLWWWLCTILCDTIIRLGETDWCRLDVVYHRESLRRGLATRTFKYPGVRTWGVKNHRLICSDRVGNVRIRTLRNDGSSENVEREIDLRQSSVHFFTILRVWVLEAGDVIFRSVAKKIGRPGLRHPGRPGRIDQCSTARFSAAGNTVWDIRHGLLEEWSEPAVGETGVFFVIEGPKSFPRGSCASSAPTLIKFSIQDGSLLSHPAPPPWDWRRDIPDKCSDGLILGVQEKFLVYTDIHHLATIFSTSSGNRLFTFHTFITDLIYPSILDDGFWIMDSALVDPLPSDHQMFYCANGHARLVNCTYFLPFREVTTELQFQPVHFPWATPPQVPNLTFDCDYSVELGSVRDSPDHQLPGQGLMECTVKVRIGTACWSPSPFPGHIKFRSANNISRVSLPPLPSVTTESRGRIPLIVKVQFSPDENRWTRSEMTYLCMAESYLIHVSRGEEAITLIDFWPRW